MIIPRHSSASKTRSARWALAAFASAVHLPNQSPLAKAKALLYPSDDRT